MDGWPPYVRATLNADPATERDRKLPLTTRLPMAEALKEEGNSCYRAKDPAGALEKYEKALGLLVFAVPDGDTFTVHSPVSFLSQEAVNLAGLCTQRPPTATDAGDANARALLVSLYLNIAASALVLQDFPLAFAATIDALRINPRPALAYYRRAEARVGAAGSNVTEQENALHDFRAAAALEPSKQRYATALAQQFSSLRAQAEDLESQLECLLHLHRELLDEGRDEKARDLYRHIQRLQMQSFLQRNGRDVNWRHPTTELLDAAKAHGLDLSDPSIVEELESVQREADGTVDADAIGTTERTLASDLATLEAAPVSLLRRILIEDGEMPRAEAEGMSETHIRERFREQARSRYSSWPSRQLFSWIFRVIIVLFLLWRLWSMGALHWVVGWPLPPTSPLQQRNGRVLPPGIA